MKLMPQKAVSIFAWITMICASVIVTPVFLLVWVATFWWDRRRVVTHFMGTFWAWLYQAIVPYWRLELKGREKIPWNRPVIMVSNHRSQADILSLYKIRRPFKWTSKSENFRMPFVGMVLTLTRSIPVNRESLRSGSKFIARAEEEIKRGSSIMLFPEGTRSKTENMRIFKEGAFLLAKKTGKPIIPIVHTGSENSFPGSSWIMGPCWIRIRVLDEIPAETVRDLSIKELMILTRERMEDALSQLEKK
ncbi:MAG: 1-acylglycerol-3-phosphate O-acyltransferase [Bacteroidetes bacterium]|nr:1-acylglycerol-3-phosphate O-acyltransferase [Bacteroidota bacterium]